MGKEVYNTNAREFIEIMRYLNDNGARFTTRRRDIIDFQTNNVIGRYSVKRNDEEYPDWITIYASDRRLEDLIERYKVQSR